MKKCPAKHTSYQPGDGEDWHCPKCGCEVDSRDGEFTIDFPDDDAIDECTKLHFRDECICTACNWVGTGQQVARMLSREKNLVTCPTCKGKGMVQSG